VHIDCTVLVLFIFSPSSSAQPSFRPKALLLPVAKDQSTLQYTTVINQHIPLVPASVVFDLGGRELWVDCDKDYVSSTYQSPRCNYAECSRAGSTSCGTCFSPPRPGCRLASGTVGMARMGRHIIGLPPQFAAAFSFSQKFAVCLSSGKGLQTMPLLINPVSTASAFSQAARNITRVASEKPFGDACFSTKNVGVTRLGYAAPEIQLLLCSNDVVWRIFRANSMVSVSDDVICLGFVDGVNLCGVHIDCTVLVLFIFSPSSSAQPSFRPKALLLPVAKDQSTLQYTTVINQHIPLVPASVVFDLGGRELWVDCDKDYVSSTYQSPRCNYAECSRAGSTSCGTCFSPPRPGCRLASGTVGMARMGRHIIGLPPQFAAAFSFSQKFAVCLSSGKGLQTMPLLINPVSTASAFSQAARNITRVASEKPFGDACFSTKNVGVTRLGYAAPEIQLLLCSNDVVWRIFRANSMVSVSDDVICLGFVDGVNLCGVHIDCTVLVLFIFSPSSSAQPSFRPKALLLPVAKDQSTLQYTTVINQHIPLVPASVVFDLGGRELWVDCDKDYVSSTYQSPRCNYAECSRAGSTSCGTCFSPPRPGCRLASGTVGMARMGRHIIGLPPQFAAAFSFSQKFAVCLSSGKGLQTMPLLINPVSTASAFSQAARNITRVASEKPFGDACFSTKNVGVTRLGYAAPEIQLLLCSNDVVWRIFRANSMVSVSDDVICLGFVDGVNLCGVHIDCTVLVLFIFSPSSSAQPSFRPKALLLPVAKDQSTLQYTTVINQHIPLVPASVVFDLGGRELWVDCDKDYVSSTYQSPRCNYAECSRAGSTSCGTCFSPPRPGCRLASGTVGMARMGRHIIGLPPQFAAAFSFSQKFAVCLSSGKGLQTMPLLINPVSTASAFSQAARNITRVASEKPFGDACFSTKNVGVTRLGYAAPEIQLLLCSNDVVWRIFRANSMVSVSDDVICLGFVDGVNLCGVHIDCTVLVLFIFSPSSSAQPSFRPKALLLPVAKDQSTLQYTTVINQHIPLVPASVVFDLGGRELWVDCDKDYVSSTYQSPRCNYAECSRAGSTSCGTCFSPPRPGCRLASGTVGMARMGRHIIGLPPQFAAAFSFSQKFAVCLSSGKGLQTMPLLINPVSTASAFSQAARNITRVASEKPFGDACFSTKNVGVTRLGYAAPEIQLLLCSNDVVWRIFRANSMVSVSDDVICLGFVDGVNLCGVHIDCTVLVLFIFSPSSSAQPSFRPKALLLPVAKDQSTLQYTTVINQHIPLVPASVVFDLGGRELWVDCDKDYVSSTYQSPRCNYAECSRAGSTSCGTCFSPPRPGCRLASGTVGMARMGRHIIGLPPQFAAAFSFSQKFAVCLSSGKGLQTMPLLINPVSTASAFSQAARNITRVASEKPFGDACFSTKNVGVTRLGYAAPEIQLLLCSNDVVWRIFRANSMVSVSDDVICLGFVDGVNLCGVHIDCTVLVLFIFSPSSSAQPSFRPKALLLPVAKDQSTLQYTTVINQHIPLVPASVVFDLGGRELWVDCDKDYVSSTYQSPRCNYAECSRAGSTSCGTCFSPPRPGCRLASGTVGMARMGRHIIGLPPQFAAAFSFSQKFAVCLSSGKGLQTMPLLINPVSTASAFSQAARNITRVASEKPFGDACFSTKNVGVTRLGYAAPEIQLLLCSNDVVWRIFRANSMVSVSDDVICLGFVDGVNLCGVHIDCTVLVLFIFSPSSSAQPSFRPKALLLPVAKDQSTLQYTTVINQHIPLVPASVVFDLGGRELWVDCDKDYVSSTYQSPRCNYAECSRAGSTSCGTCFSPPRPGCRLASGTVGMARMGRHIIGLPPQFAAAFSFSQKFAVCLSSGKGLQTMPLLINPVSTASAFSQAARNITRVASEKPFGDACFSTKNVGVTRLGYAAPEIQLLLCSNDVVWRIFRANSMVSVSDDVICLGFVDGVNLCGVHIDCTVLVLFIFSPSSSAQPSFRPKALLLPVAKDQSTLQYTTVINQHIPLVPASVVFDLGGRELWVDCDKDYVSSTYQSPRCNYAECSRAGSTSCGTCFSPPRPGCRLASGTVGMARMGRHIIGLPPQFAAAFSFSQKFAVCLSSGKGLQTMPLLINPVSTASAFSQAARNITRVASEKPFGDACFSTKNVGVTRLGYAAPEIQLLLCSNDVVWRIFRANSMVSVSDDVICLGFVDGVNLCGVHIDCTVLVLFIFSPSSSAQPSFRPKALLLPVAKDQSTLQYTTVINQHIPLVPASVVFDLGGRELWVDCDKDYVSSTYQSPRCNYAECSRAGSTSCGTCFSPPRPGCRLASGTVGMARMGRHIIGLPPQFAAAFSFSQKFAVCLSSGKGLQTMPLLINPVSTASAFSQAARNITRVASEKPFGDACFSTKNVGVTRLGYAAPEIQLLLCSNDVVWRIFRANSMVSVSDDVICLGFVDGVNLCGVHIDCTVLVLFIFSPSSSAQPSFRPKALLLPVAKDQSTLQYTTVINQHIPLVPASVVFDLGGRELWVDCDKDYVSSTYQSPRCNYAECSRAGSTSCGTCFSPPRPGCRLASGTVGMARMGRHIIGLPPQFAAAFSFSQKFAVCLSSGKGLQTMPLLINPVSTASAFSQAARNITRVASEKPFGDACFSTKNVGVTRLGYAAPEIQLLLCSNDVVWRIFRANSMVSVSDDVICLGFVDGVNLCGVHIDCTVLVLFIFSPSSSAQPSFRPKALLLPVAKDQSTLQYTTVINQHIPLVPASVVFDLGGRELWVDCDKDYVSSTYQSPRCNYAECSRAGSTSCGTCFSPPRPGCRLASGTVGMARMGRHIIGLPPQFAAAFSFSQKFAVCLSSGKGLQTMPLLINPVSTASAFSQAARNITRVASEKPFGDACFSTKNVGVTRLGYAAPEIQLLLCSNDVVWRIFRANSMVSVSDDVICLGFVDGVNLCGVHIDCTVLVLFIFSPSSSAQPSFRPKALLLPVAKDQSTLQYTTVINQHIPLVPASVVFDLGGRELWVDCDKDYVSSTYQSPRCNYAECSRAGSTSCGTCFSPPRPGCRLASGTVGMARMGRHIIGLPPQFAAAFSFSQKFAVCLSSGKGLQTMPLLINPVSTASAFSQAARNITRVASEKPFGDACFSTKNVGVTRLGYAAPEIQLLLCSNDVVWRIFRANSMVSVSDDVICLGFVDGVNLCGVHIDCTVLVLFIFSPSSSAQPSFRPKALLLPVAKDQSTLQYTTVINQHIPLVPASVVFDLGGRELWVDCDKDYVSSTYQSPRCNYAECSRAGSTSCGTCFSPPRPGCRLASGTVGMARMGRHIIGLPPQFAAAFSFSQKFAVCLSSGKGLQTMPLLINPYRIRRNQNQFRESIYGVGVIDLQSFYVGVRQTNSGEEHHESSVGETVWRRVFQHEERRRHAPGIRRAGDSASAFVATTSFGGSLELTRCGEEHHESSVGETVRRRVFQHEERQRHAPGIRRAGDSASASIATTSFGGSLELTRCSLHLLTLIICSTIFPSQSSLLPVAKDQSTLQYTTVINQHIPLVPASVVFDLGGRELWVDCDKDYVSSTYQSSRCNYAECSRAGSTSYGTCFSPPRPGCRLASGTVGMDKMGRHIIGLPPQFAAAFSFSQKFAVCLSSGKGLQTMPLLINPVSTASAFSQAARNITRVASEKPFGDACFSTKNVGVTRLGYAAPEIQLLLCSNDVVWRIFRANSMVSVSDDVICLGFVDGVNLCGVHIDCTVLVLFIFSPSSSAQPSFRPKALLLPVAKDQSTLQYTTVINQHIPLVPASVVFDLGGRELWVDCDKDYVSSTYQSPRCNYAECSRAGSTSCGTCFSPPRPGCRLASGTVGMARMGRHIIGLPPQFAAAFSFSQKFAVCLSSGKGLQTMPLLINPVSTASAFSQAARNITRVASEKPFGDACFSTKNVGVTRLGYAAPEIQLLLCSNDVVWRIFRANSMVSVSDDVICLGFVDGVNLCGVHIDCTVLVLFIFSPSSSAQPSFRPKALLLPVAKDQSTLQYTTVINQHIPLVPASVVFDLGGRELWVDCDKDYVSSTYQSPRCNYAECSRAGSTSCGTCFSPPRPGCRLASGTVGMARMGRHIIGLPPQFAAAFSFSQKFAVCLSSGKGLQTMPLLINPVSTASAFSQAARNITRVASEKPFGDACFSTKNVGVTRLGYAAPEIQLLLCSNDVVWRIFRANSMVSVSDDVICLGFVDGVNLCGVHIDCTVLVLFIFSPSSSAQPSFRPKALLLPVAKDQSTLQYTTVINQHIPLVPASVVFDLGGRELWVDCDKDYVSSTYQSPRCNYAECSRAGSTSCGTCFSPPRPGCRLASGTVGMARMGRHIIGLPPQFAAAFSFSQKFAVCLSSGKGLQTMPLLINPVSTASAFSQAARNITRVASEKPFGDACFSTKNVGVTRLGYAAPEIQLLLCSNDVVWRIFRANSMVSVSDDVICLGFVDGVNLCGVHIDCTVLVLFIFSPSSSAQPSFRPKALLLPVAKDQSTLQYTTVINQHIPLVPASVVFDLGGRELWVDCDKDYVSSTYQSPRCNYAECSRAGSTSCGTCFSPPRPGCRLASGTVGMARMGRHIIGLPPQFAAAFSFSQKFAVCLSSGKGLQTMPLLINPVSTASAFSQAARNITRVASEKPFGDACFSTKNVGVTRLGYAAPEIQLLLCSNDVVWRIFRANSMVSVSDDVICLGFVDGVNLCGVHIDCTVLVLFIFSPSSSAQPSFRPKALLLPVAKDQSTLQYTTVINQHIPLVPASVVFDLGGRELWVDCDKDYVSSTYQSPRCNYAECSRAGSTSCGTCFSPPRPGCRLASGTVGMARMGRHIIGLPPQFAAAFSFSQKFAVCLSSGKGLQTMPLLINPVSTASAFSQAARNITRVASEKPFGDACFSTKNVGVTRLGYAAPEIQLLLRSNDVVWRIFRANSMVSVSDDVICLGFVDGVNLCGVHIDCTVLVLFIFSPSSSAQPSFRPKALLLPVAKDQSTLQYTTVINQHIPLVPASVVFDLGGRELWVDCDKDYVSSTYQSPRCNYAECSRAGSTSCGTCFSPPRPGCRLASGTVGMAGMGRHNIGLPPQFAAAFSFSQKFAVCLSSGKGLQTMPLLINPVSTASAFSQAARNITRVASEKPFGDACFSTKNVAVTRLGYAVPEIQLLLHSNDVVWRIFRANSMVSVSDDVICLGFVDGVNLCGVHIDCTVLVLFIFSPSSSAQPSFRPKALLLPVAKDQSTLQYTTVINQHIPLVPASVVFDLGGRELWVDCDKDYVSSTYQSPRCNYAECSRAGSTSCGTCFSPPRPGCRLASGTVGMARMGRHIIGLPPQFAAAFSFSQKFAVCLSSGKGLQTMPLLINPVSTASAFSQAARNITRVASEKPFGDACFSTKNVGVTRLGYAAPEIQLLLRSNDVVWRIFRANSMVSVSDDVICLGFVDGVNLCGVHIDCTVLVLFIFSPSSSAQPSFRPKALLLPVAKDQSTLQYTTVINQHIPLVPASVVFDLGGRELWVDCDKDYVSSTYQSPRCNYAECSRAGSTSCGTCFSPPRPGCRLASGTVGMAGMGRYNIGLPPQFAAAFIFSQKFAVCLSSGKGLQTMPLLINPVSTASAFSQAARNITRVASEKPFGDACFSTKNVAVTRLGYAVPEIQLLLHSNDVVWRIFRANSMTTSLPLTNLLVATTPSAHAPAPPAVAHVSLLPDLAVVTTLAAALQITNFIFDCGATFLLKGLASRTVCMAGMGRYNIVLPPQFAAAFSFSQKFAVCLSSGKGLQTMPLLINPVSTASAFSQAARNITRVASEKPFGDSCFSTKNVAVTRLGYAVPEILLLLHSNDVVWRIFRANSMVSVSDDVICLGFVDGVNLCGVDIDCTVLVLFIFSPSSSAQPSFRPKALLLPVAKDQSTLQYTTVINQHIPLIPASVVFDLRGRELWVDCDKDYVSSTYQSPRCNYAECSRAGSTSCGTCFSPPRPGCRLASGTVGMAGMGRYNIGLPPQFAAAFIFSQKFAVCLSSGKGLQTMPLLINPVSTASAFSQAARNITRVASEKPFGDACFSTKNVAVTRLGYAVPEIQLLLHSNDVVWRIFRANSMTTSLPLTNLLVATTPSAHAPAPPAVAHVSLLPDLAVVTTLAAALQITNFIFDCGATFLLKGLASRTVCMAGMGRYNIGLPPQFAAAFSFSQKFAVCLSSGKGLQTMPLLINPVSTASAFSQAARNITRVASEKPFGDSCFSTKNVAVTRLGYAVPEILLLLHSNDVVWRIFRANSMVSVSDDVICLGFVDGVNLCGVDIDCTVLVLFIFSPSSSAQPSFRPKALLLPVAKDQSTLQYTTVINQHIPLIPASVVFDLRGRELWVDCDKDYVSSTYQSPRCNYAECSRAGSTSCGTCFSPPRPGCRLASRTVGMAGMGRYNIGLPPQFAAAFSFSQKFAVCLSSGKGLQTMPLLINPVSTASAFSQAARNITRVASEKPFGDSCFSTKNVAVTRLGYAVPEIQLLLHSNDVVWRIFRANSMTTSLPLTNLLVATTPSAHAPAPPAVAHVSLLPDLAVVTTLAAALQITNFIFDCGATFLLKGLASGTIGMGGMGRHIIGLPPQFAAAFIFSQKFAVCLSSGKGLQTMPLLINPVSTASAFSQAARNITRVASEKPFGDACFSTKNVGVTRLGYAAPEIQLLLRSNDVVWRIFRANSMVSVSDDVICLGFVDGVNLCGVHIDCTVLVLFIFSPSSSAQPSFRPKALVLPVAKDQSTLQYTTVINQHIPLVPASVVFDLGGRELWVDCDKDYVSSTYQSPRCNYAECSRAGSTSCGTCFSPPRPGCRLASGTVGMARMGRHIIGLPPQFTAAFSFSQKFSVCLSSGRGLQTMPLLINPVSTASAFSQAARNITRVASEKPFGDACFSTKNVGVTRLGYAAPEIQLLLCSNDVVWRIFRANSMVSVSDDVICLGFVDGVNLCGVHIDCTVLVLFIFSPSSSAQPSFRPKALLLPVAKDQSTLQYTTVINQHIPLVPASVVFDLGGRELWVDCDKDYVSSTYQSPRCNYAECSRAGSTSCGTCFSPPRPGCRLASGTVGMAGMGRHIIGLPTQFAAAFSFSQKFAVCLSSGKGLQTMPLLINPVSTASAFSQAARNITRVASEKPFGDACFSTKNVGVTRLGYAAPEILLLLRSNDVVWRIFRANSMTTSLPLTNLLVATTPSAHAPAPPAGAHVSLLPDLAVVTTLAAALQITNFIFDCGATFLLKGLASGTVGMAGMGRYNIGLPPQFAAAFSFSQKFAVCLSSGKGLQTMPLLINPFQRLKINASIGFGGTKISSVNPYTVLESSIYKASTSEFVKQTAARNITRVASEKPFGDACFSTKNIGVTRLGYAAPEIQLCFVATTSFGGSLELTRWWTATKTTSLPLTNLLIATTPSAHAPAPPAVAHVSLLPDLAVVTTLAAALQITNFIFDCGAMFLLKGLASRTVGMAEMGRHNIGLPPQFAAAFSFSQKFAVCLTSGKGLQTTPLLINPVSTASAFSQAARNITRVASEKPFGDACFSTKNVGVKRLGYAVLEIQLLLHSNDVVWRIFRANSMVSVSDDVICLGFVDGVNLCGDRRVPVER
ncbi:Aspartic peptidase domain superfamily, partial [Arabidopsis suecica]